MSQASMRAPQLIAGRYALDSPIGEGGMAVVWKANDRTLQRTVAVKLLEASGRDRDALAERFLREARLAAAVENRHVVRVVDFGRAEDGTPFMVMEYLQGQSFADFLYESPRPPIDEVARVIALALRGLEAVHAAGIVHRDIKPDNIFLSNDVDGVCPKLLDFGISRVHKPSSGQKSAYTTHEGLLIGTPQYMSPEQARGLRDVDERADIYSMGVVLYEALAGTLPYVSENPGDLLVAVIHGGAASVAMLRPEVGESLSRVVSCAMSVERAERYADARAMRRALLDAVPGANRAGDHTSLLGNEPPSGIRARPRSGFPTTNPTVDSLKPPPLGLSRKQMAIGAAVAGIVTLVALGAWLASTSDEATARANPTSPAAPAIPTPAPALAPAPEPPTTAEVEPIPEAEPAPAAKATRSRATRRPRRATTAETESSPSTGAARPATFRRLDY